MFSRRVWISAASGTWIQNWESLTAKAEQSLLERVAERSRIAAYSPRICTSRRDPARSRPTGAVRFYGREKVAVLILSMRISSNCCEELLFFHAVERDY